MSTRSLGALRAPTSRLRPFGPALGPSGLLNNVLHALRALRRCDPRNDALDSDQTLVLVELVLLIVVVVVFLFRRSIRFGEGFP